MAYFCCDYESGYESGYDGGVYEIDFVFYEDEEILEGDLYGEEEEDNSEEIELEEVPTSYFPGKDDVGVA